MRRPDSTPAAGGVAKHTEFALHLLKLLCARAALAKMGLALDNSLYHTQLDELAELARAVPELTIALSHIGRLVRVGPYENRDNEVFTNWRRGA